ncbi:hypothetical protein [Tenacibaculum crassostreae]|uniref:hypothetical protein n=1 Tax=Tenacibaculum crassostreae TaxID=502683 RepID=UPI0038931643
MNNNIINFDSKFKFQNSNTNKLSELKPAGTKLILEPKTSLIDLLKLTLFDLVLKKVLIIKKTLKKSHPRDPYLREYIIVETGKNFSKYQPDQFEKTFISRIDEESYFHLRSYLTGIYKDIESEYKYKKSIILDLNINIYYKNNIIYQLFSLLKVNDIGQSLKNDITTFLNQVDKEIGDLVENKPEKALELILFLKGNIFLLENLNFEIFEKLKPFLPITQSHNDEYDLDLFLFDFYDDSDLSISDISYNLTEVFDSIDDYFDSGSNWDGDYDFYID